MATSESSPKSHAATIVLADNDNFVLETMGELLRAKGYDVYTARDGLEALQLIRKVKPTYVIMDIIMPMLDGSRVCWLMRQEPDLRDIPVIAYSSISAQDFRHFPELSADAYVAKGPLPVAFENILQAISHADMRGRGDVSNGLFGYASIRPRQLVEELLKERRHYANILHSLGRGVMELNETGHIIMANPGACEILKQKEANIIGEPLTSLCQPQDRKVLQDLLSELGKANTPGQFRTVVKFGDMEMPLRLCAIVEERQCTGLLVIMEASEANAEETNGPVRDLNV